MEPLIERDMPEVDAEEREKKEAKKYLLEDLMGEQYHNYFWDERHSL